MSKTTKSSSSRAISVTVENKFWTSLPDSENQRENSECEFISNRCVFEYLLESEFLSHT